MISNRKSSQHQSNQAETHGIQQLMGILGAMHQDNVSWEKAEDDLGFGVNTKEENDQTKINYDDEELDELVAFALGETGVDLPDSAKFDPSFLEHTQTIDKTVATKPIFYLEEAAKVVIKLSNEIVQAWASAVVQLQTGSLSPALVNVRNDRGRVLYEHAMTDLSQTGSDIYQKVDIQIVEDTKNADLCNIYVTTLLSNREPFSSDSIEVTLKHREQQLDQQWSDGSGKVIFQRIKVVDIADLTFEIISQQ